ncbi:hypothetical protein GYMLUDRAFT_45713 [Collybiopsis luxurians FD-317 M1]|uniref:Uncharacterized protein n=1 Tax=Collybiopsis luxurians FD-317 M1 TaxID=944289 RepID=A0A0D0BRP6_9AGAR|nr:hypothetical protein GYMLUDRAFT_45713 [Collybiopsis luxurians FD-317 M1]
MSVLSFENLTILEYESIASSVGSALHGLYIGVAALSLWLLLSGGNNSSIGNRFLLIVIFIMLFFDMINTASSIYFIAHDIRTFGGHINPILTRIVILVDMVVVKLNYFLSDLVIVWRAWSIFDRKPIYVQLLLAACLCASLGAAVADMTISVELTMNLRTKFTLVYPKSRAILPSVLLLTNTVATALIAFRTWKFYRTLKYTGFQDTSSIKCAIHMLLFMVESGFLYSVLWIIVILDMMVQLSPEVSYFLSLIIPHLTGIYPCLMVILIVFEKQKYDSMTGTAWSTSPDMSTSTV